MERRPIVYGASKLQFAPLWLSLHEKEPDIYWIARWPTIEGHVEDTPENAKTFWLHDIADVQKCDYVMCLPPPAGEQLRGALVEVGAALGLGKSVVLVGDDPAWATWQYHPLVQKVATVEEACKVIKGNWV